MAQQNKPNSKRILTGFGNAFHGIWVTFREERHMQFHFIIAIVVTLTGFFFHLNPLEWVAILSCFALVFTTEIINTAFENLCDLVIQEKHPVVKKIKDMAAGAVLVCSIYSVIVGLIVFIPKIGTLFIINH